MNLPRTRARKKSHASRTRAKREMHWQAIAANKALMVADIGQVLEQGWPFG